MLTCRICEAQNLVPNGNFEQYSGCPDFYGQLDSALYWINPNEGTPDYFNVCSTFFNTGVPSNGLGVQPSHSGSAYGGIELFYHQGENSREYMEVPLLSALVANQHYHFEMYANLGDRGNYSTDALQAYFSDTLIANIDSAIVLPFTPQISNDSGVFLNTTAWTLISGNYMAHGGESYLLIGNFKNDSSTALQFNVAYFIGLAYSYIDDVSLTIATGIDDQTETGNINLFPNPVNDRVTISTYTNSPSEITFYDMDSRKLLQEQFINSVTLNTKQLAKGLYLYEVRNKNGVIKKGKSVKD
jgi:hypothetical protein